MSILGKFSNIQEALAALGCTVAEVEQNIRAEGVKVKSWNMSSTKHCIIAKYLQKHGFEYFSIGVAVWHTWKDGKETDSGDIPAAVEQFIIKQCRLKDSRFPSEFFETAEEEPANV